MLYSEYYKTWSCNKLIVCHTCYNSYYSSKLKIRKVKLANNYGSEGL